MSLRYGCWIVLVFCLLNSPSFAKGAKGSHADSIALANQLLDQAEKAQYQRTRALAVRAAIQLLDSEDSAPLKRAFDLLTKELTQPPRVSKGMLYALIALTELPNVKLYGPDLNLIEEKAKLAMQIYNLPASAYKEYDGDPDEHEAGVVSITVNGLQLVALGVILANGNHDFLNVPEVCDFFLANLNYNENSDPYYGADKLRDFVKGCLYTLNARAFFQPDLAKKLFEELVVLLQKRLDVPGFHHLYVYETATDLIEKLTEYVDRHGGGESFLAVLDKVIKLKGKVPLTQDIPKFQAMLFCTATLAKEKLVTDWSGGNGGQRPAARPELTVKPGSLQDLMRSIRLTAPAH
jgi:hypothetical protein